MIRLLKSGLIYGNLFPVTSSALVTRYNRALDHLIGKTTQLKDFHIDISGFAPEIAEELDDPLYLNPGGCNRMFILLSADQKTAPLIDTKFSPSRDVLRDWIVANENALFALTARDAVAGEIVNSVYDISAPARLMDIRTLTVEADSVGGHVRDAAALQRKITRFRDQPDAWWDDVLIAEMIDLAKTTGDITRNPIALKSQSFRAGNLWTQHFSGLYLFRDVDHPAAITAGPVAGIADLPLTHRFDLGQANHIARFLSLNDLAHPITDLPKDQARDILRDKIEILAAGAAAAADEEVAGLSPRDLRRLTRRHATALPAAFHGLNRLLRYVDEGGAWPKIASDDPAYFYTLRARQGPDRDLVNMLLAELTPLDAQQLYICHKQAFYAAYRGWPEQMKAFVVDRLLRSYATDKEGRRALLYGGDVAPPPPPSRSQPGSKPAQTPELIDMVGPWGAVRRR